MHAFGSQLSPHHQNPLKTKSDVTEFLFGILDALERNTSPGGARIHLGFTGTHYDQTAAELEGFARPMWGLGAHLGGVGSGQQAYHGTSRWANGLKNGTDPSHEEFWGAMRDKDQRMVECSPIGFALSLGRKELWDPLADDEKKKLEDWLGGMNDKEMPNTNWLWFRVFSNLGLSKVSSTRYSPARLQSDLKHLDSFYIKDGWSRDGPEGVVQLDYYSSSYAIQYAQLVYAKLAEIDDAERSEMFKERARQFLPDFLRYFDEEGRAIPFGRSMTYRFAMSSFFAALAYAFSSPTESLPSPLTWGTLKGLLFRNLRYWARQPGAWNPDGTLSIGYCYPNMNLTENYNSGGSPYWCCKSFLVLALPDDHPFWLEEEEPYPFKEVILKEPIRVLRHPLHIASNIGGHTMILSSGQQCSYPVKQGAAKYGKFAYSSAFGYSVSAGFGTLEEIAGDNMLVLGDVEDVGEPATLRVGKYGGSWEKKDKWGEGGWKVRRDTRNAKFENSTDGKRVWLRSSWIPWKGFEVETWLVPPDPGNSPLWHLRIHRIRNASRRRIVSAEGGFAIHGQASDQERRALAPTATEETEEEGTYENSEKGEARACSKAGVVGIVDLTRSIIGNTNNQVRGATALRTDANTNLIAPRAIVPTLHGLHEPSASGEEKDEWIVTGVFALPAQVIDGGERGAAGGWIAEWNEKRRPKVPDEILSMIQASLGQK